MARSTGNTCKGLTLETDFYKENFMSGMCLGSIRSKKYGIEYRVSSR